MVTGVEKDNETTTLNSFVLEQNYPNPFNPSTTIQYKVGNQQFVVLKVYDVLGNEVEKLVSEEKPAGVYEVKFDASVYSSGIYFYKLEVYAPGRAGNFIDVKKMILIK
jgi:hypothetical protein